MYKAPRGTHDILPDEWPYWQRVMNLCHELAVRYGYERLETPIFEETSLFVRGVGEGTDIVDKEMYTFRKGKSDLSLRPECTAGTMRAYLEHGMHTRPKPVKVYSLGSIFRYDRPQAGRYRQFWQFNIEAIGEIDPAVDVEVMSIAWQVFRELGFHGLSFQINSTGCPLCRPEYENQLRLYYRPHENRLDGDDRRRLEKNPLRLLDSKSPKAQPLIDGAPKINDNICEECAKHFATVRRYLEILNRSYTVNHRLVRGLDYYTKTVFEVYAEGIGAQNALCGGGRYDGLIEELGGKPTPGVGFAMGLERVILLMKEQDIVVPDLPRPAVYLAYLGDEAKLRAVRLSESLRDAKIGVQMAFGNRSLGAQMKAANRAGARFVLMLGEDELAQESVTLRDMADGSQELVPLAQVVARLQDETG